MPESPLAAIVGRLVRGLPPTDGTADAALLARFVGWRDEAAFELLVYRHGPMVRGLCRRILRHEQDAEDAFQATFLALAKKAGTIRGQSLPGWLYRVAFHAALKAKAKGVPCPRLCVGMSEQPILAQSRGHGSQNAEPANELQDREFRAALDEEVLRLPERFRGPVVMCYLEGRSNREVGIALGIPKGTVDSRLATARQRLRIRLLRRGFAPAVAGVAIDGVLDTAELPGSVVRAVTKAAVAFISKQAGVPATAAILAEGVLQTMYVTKLKWVVAGVLTLAMLGSSAGVATYGARSDDQAPKVADKEPPLPPKPPVDPQRDGHKSADGRPKRGENSFAALCDALQKPIGLDRETPPAPLKDVLDFMSDKFQVTFIVDVQAFLTAGVGGGVNVQDTQVSLPKMPGVTLSTALRFLLAQINGTYLIRKDYIEITTVDRQVSEAFEPGMVRVGDFPPTVNVVFENRPLEKALADLASQTGKNIVLDPRVADRDKLVVSGQFLNTPMDSVVRVVADMVDLEPIRSENIYYVTTKENAARLHNQWLKPTPAPTRTPKPAAPPASPGRP